MKNTLWLTLLLLASMSVAVAQSPATMTKGNDTLCNDTRLSVEIISVSGFNLDHPTHPATGVSCPFFDGFTTSQPYAWYQWESSFTEPSNSDIIIAEVYFSGYIKVTVDDGNGHTGSDSIWFYVMNKDVPPMEGFIMEIDEDLHPKFNGTATEDHKKLVFWRKYEPGGVSYRKEFSLTPGEWSYEDNVSYSEDSLWIYNIAVYDACESSSSTLIPGLLLGTVVDQYGTAWLTMKTIIQKDDGLAYGNKNFVYFVYTIDEDGNRHHFKDYDNNPVVIENPLDTCWLIPAPHIDPYYQMGVGRQLEDGNYELLSLSNKVPNPWPDTDAVNENSEDEENHEDEESTFDVFPNPSHDGRISVLAKGVLTVFNVLGQEILTQEINDKTEITLPQGIYVSRLVSQKGKIITKKIIAQ